MASASNIAIQLQKLANQQTEKSFKYNTQEANTARAWQTQMSNTSHQREVQDLIKAGLNPVLSSGGQGAQSYTTSSASAQADSPVNAIGGVYQSQISADAQRAAAAQSAAAMKAAAATQAAATRYAAAMQYQTQKDSWKWKTDYMKEDYKQKTNYMKSEYSEKLKLPVSNVASLIDKYATRTGVSDTIVGSVKAKSILTSAFSGSFKNPSTLFKDNVSKIGSNPYSQMNSIGKNKVNYALNRLGVVQNNTTRNLLSNAIFKGSAISWTRLVNYMPKKIVSRGSKHSATHIR